MYRGKKYLLTCSVLLGMMVLTLTGCTSKEERLKKQEDYRKIGITAMESGDYIAAQEAFNKALSESKRIGANEMDICYYKAAAQFAAGSLTDAIETYGILLERDDENGDVYFLRGCVYLKNNEIDKALKDFSNAVEYAKDDEIYLEIYHGLSAAGYEAEGQTYLAKALEKKAGKKAKNYTVKGRIYLLKGQYDSAAEQLKTAIEKGDVEANLYLAKIYEAMGDTTQADACIQAYIKEYPESSVAFNQKGKQAMESGDYAGAVEYFNKGLALEEVTNEQELRSNLIAAYEYTGDFTSAKTEMEAYMADYPDDPAARRESLFLNRGSKMQEDTETE
ncbi:MAG: tetratricopeptide repeat protein [Lachnospiraceae bacterium]|nr:tetratricopeptide repeat protein [Lachnospiraceae bacterium]